MLDTKTLKTLIEAVRDAQYTRFAIACSDVFEYIDQNVDRPNDVFDRLESDRKTKWMSFAPSPLNRSLPKVAAERRSLAWDLFRSASEQDDDGSGLTFSFYRRSQLQENIDRFLHDWLADLVACVQEIAKAEAPDADEGRQKQQKFGILDAVNLLPADLEASVGRLGRAVLFVDLDNLKALNTALTELQADRLVLVPVHKALRECAKGNAFSYAQGGDEFIFLLPNATEEMAISFAKAIHAQIGRLILEDAASGIALSVSVGVAHQQSGESEIDIGQRANEAEAAAKKAGKNRVALWQASGAVVVHQGT